MLHVGTEASRHTDTLTLSPRLTLAQPYLNAAWHTTGGASTSGGGAARRCHLLLSSYVCLSVYVEIYALDWIDKVCSC